MSLDHAVLGVSVTVVCEVLRHGLSWQLLRLFGDDTLTTVYNQRKSSPWQANFGGSDRVIVGVDDGAFQLTTLLLQTLF